jgi:hypothetical protein
MSVHWKFTATLRVASVGLALMATTSMAGAHAASPDAHLPSVASSSAWAVSPGERAGECAIVLSGLGSPDAAVAASDMTTLLVADGVPTLGTADAQPAAGLFAASTVTLATLQELLAQVQAHPACDQLILAYAGGAANGALLFASASGQPAPLSLAALAGLLQPLATRGTHLTVVLDAPLPAHAADAFAGFGLQGSLINTPTRPLVLAAASPLGQDPLAALTLAASHLALPASPFSAAPLAPPTVTAVFGQGIVAVTGTYTLLSPAVTPCGSAPASYTAALKMRLVNGMFLILVPGDDNAINPGTINADGSFTTARDGETYSGTIDASGTGSATDTYGYDSCTWTYHVTFAPAGS